jgi:hypothetical protein
MTPIARREQPRDRCCSAVVFRTIVSPDLPGECSRSVHDICPEHVGHLATQLSKSSARGLAFAPVLRSLIR